jgi:hypothetical protein
MRPAGASLNPATHRRCGISVSKSRQRTPDRGPPVIGPRSCGRWGCRFSSSFPPAAPRPSTVAPVGGRHRAPKPTKTDDPSISCTLGDRLVGRRHSLLGGSVMAVDHQHSEAESAGIRLSVGQVANWFFNRSASWIRWQEREGVLETGGEAIGGRLPAARQAGCRSYSLDDVCAIADALLDHGRLDPRNHRLVVRRVEAMREIERGWVRTMDRRTIQRRERMRVSR